MDIFVYMIIALWLGFRLWNVLGKRPDSSSPSTSNVIRLRQDQVHVEKPAPFYQEFYEGFDESHFLTGAKKAFVKVLEAHFQKDVDTLSKFVSPKLLNTLKKQPIPDPVPEIKVLSLHIQERVCEGDLARICVHFLFSKTWGSQSREAEESWVFERLLSANHPNWVVSEMKT